MLQKLLDDHMGLVAWHLRAERDGIIVRYLRRRLPFIEGGFRNVEVFGLL